MRKIIKISIVVTLALVLTLPSAAVFTDIGKLIDVNGGGNEPIEGPPFVPSNPDPEQGANGVSLTTQLRWYGGDPDPLDNIYYDIFFGIDIHPQYFDTVGPFPGSQIEIFYNFEQSESPLELDTHYNWQIVAYDEDAWFTPGPIWDFTTESVTIAPPYEPSNPDPASGSTNVNINSDLSWDGGDPDPGDEVFYNVYFGTDPKPPLVEKIGPYPWNQTRITWDPGTLDYSTEYYWSITAYNTLGGITPGPVWNFTTEEPLNNPPYMPSNPDPVNGAIYVDIETNLSWDGGDPDPGDEVTYYIFFGTVPNPPYIENIGPYPWDQIQISWDPGILNHNTTYYWKILAYDGESYLISPIWNFTTEEANNPPYTPSNPDPANGSTGVDIDADLSWDGGDPDPGDNVYYDIYFGTEPTPPFIETIGPYPAEQTEISWDPGTLDYSTQYYWQIMPFDDQVCGMPSPVWEFTTEAQPNDPPFIPSNPDPANGSTGVDIDADLSWDGGDPDLGDFVYYDIYFGTDPVPPLMETIGPYSSNQIRISWDPGTLEYDTHYYWQIVAYDTFEHVSAGPIWDFTTEEVPNNPPFPPSNPDPANGSSGVNINKILSWTCDDPDGDLLTYDVYFGTVTPPPKVISNQTVTTYDPGTMSYSTRYYWQIVAWDIHEASTEGPIWEFTTEEEPNQPPYEPSNPDPPNHAIDVDVNADLSWTGGDPDMGDIVSYDVYFGTNPSPPKVVGNQSGTSYDPGTMDYLTMYYWQIVAWDDQGAHTEGPIWDFTTEEEPNQPPYEPSNPDPPNHAIDVDINADLSWTGGDPNPGDIVTYDIYFGTDPSPPQVVWNQSATTYDPGTMDYLTMYYWQIVAWDDQGAHTDGPIWNFTTEEPGNNPPSIPIISGPIAAAPEIDLEFSAISFDPEEDQVFYNFSWGDGNYSGWLGPIDSGENLTVNYSWSSNGIYEIQVKAKDTQEAESDWSEPYIITISKQMEISNIKSGYVYFRSGILDGSYAYIYLLDTFGFSVVLSDILTVEASASGAVHSVEFKIIHLLLGDNLTYVDDDGSDGFSANFTIPSGLWTLFSYAYDENENLIDENNVEYLLFYTRGSSEQLGWRVGRLKTIVKNRLINR